MTESLKLTKFDQKDVAYRLTVAENTTIKLLRSLNRASQYITKAYSDSKYRFAVKKIE